MFNQDYYATKGSKGDFFHNAKGANGVFHYAQASNAQAFRENYFKTTGNDHYANYYKNLTVVNKNNSDNKENLLHRLEMSFNFLF
ncbi:hypothetical protein [Halanaerobium praevalens]|uniref:Uncharacterized protein n=1 Tax=Halanaerobium praevalens (strain ATCC 33744 / DSM 2228 / GSL) TaxID=572479 RepID=E3DLF9_HALPG|nr:hypothetical protein [Halanaerobium praevalens]ADO77198.1 hypothetical protein Hprae_1046 [Halanaerobium praevalens DSM 2228]